MAERRLGEAIEDDIIGRIVRGANLLQDNMLLALKFLGIELRIP